VKRRPDMNIFSVASTTRSLNSSRQHQFLSAADDSSTRAEVWAGAYTPHPPTQISYPPHSFSRFLQFAAYHERVIVHAALVYDGHGLAGAVHVETGNAFESSRTGLVEAAVGVGCKGQRIR
jgi:hypothetical protein